MENIPIEQMDERRLRVELISALSANRLLLEENRSLRIANLSFAPNQIKLRAENKRLEKSEQKLYALEAAGVDNWSGYEYAMEIMNENENE